MYKVFIENRPIIFTENKNKNAKSYSIQATLLKSIKKELIPIIHKLDEKIQIFIECKKLEEEIERLFEPYEKITAAGGIVRRKNKFLFIKRNGFWDIPKGKMEKNESPEEAAIREIEEECGIVKPEISELIGVTYHTYEFNNMAVLKKTFWFSLEYDGPKEIYPQVEEGISKVEWLKVNELDKVRKKTFASIIEVMDIYFGYFEG